jgi:N-methylhydantoinase A/oxoprolinase/acetone carboxylase beta subunit
MWTVDIDVGGTLTDGLFTSGDNFVCVKVDTTPHDLTVCLFDCLNQAAEKMGFLDAVAFLENVDLIRWSTTITSNVLAELRGPRIGLLVTKGHEQNLYGKDDRSAILGRLVNDRDIIGINGSAQDTDIMNAARSLLERGVRRICISLNNSHRNPEREMAFKRIIDQQYPDHFLGSVPVLAGSDISKSADDRTRTYCAAINAYTHGALAATLFKAEDALRETSKYSGTFLVSHINGGFAGIAKTKAIDTIESGPVLGILGSAHLAKLYGLNDVIAMDIGGTTAKISVLSGGEPIYRKPSDLFGNSLELALPYLRSMALGGGSVVKPLDGAKGAEVRLGPESMGSFPGPACYGLGGDQATLTDSFVTAGLINPDYFLGGRKPIDRDLARKAIESLVAQPLRLAAEAACKMIIERAFKSVAHLIASAQKELQLNLSRHTLFAYGGNGGLFAAGVAEKAGLETVLVFSLGPLFSAFGSSVSDICHVYERSIPEPDISEAGVGGLRQFVDEIKAECVKDLLGEGIRPDDLTYAIEFEVAGSAGPSVTVACPETALGSASELKAALSTALAARGKARTGNTSLEMLRVRVKKAMRKARLVDRAFQGADASHARIGTRTISWGSRASEAQVYRWESLHPGNRVAGCAVLEGVNTTYFIPDGWAMTIDQYSNGKLARV